MDHPTDTFISEAIQPAIADMLTDPMQSGAPGLPQEFIWRGKEFVVNEVVKTWSERSPCKHGSREVYSRKHWYEITTTCGKVMRIYFERQMRSVANKHKRWWLYSVR